jgi:hypothetical protein
MSAADAAVGILGGPIALAGKKGGEAVVEGVGNAIDSFEQVGKEVKYYGASYDPVDESYYHFHDKYAAEQNDVDDFSKSEMAKRFGDASKLVGKARVGTGKRDDSYKGWVAKGVDGKMVDMNQVIAEFQIWKAKNDASKQSYNDYVTDRRGQPGRAANIFVGPTAQLLAGAEANLEASIEEHYGIGLGKGSTKRPLGPR